MVKRSLKDITDELLSRGVHKVNSDSLPLWAIFFILEDLLSKINE